MTMMKKISAMAMATAMAATMAVGTALSVSAADAPAYAITASANDVVDYTSAAFYKTDGSTPPLNMSTACIAENGVSTDSDGYVTVDLKTGYVSIWNWNLISVTIEGCKLKSSGVSIYQEGKLEIAPDDITVVYNEDGTVAYGYVDVSVTFGGDITTIISLTPMTNPMDLQLRLF